MHKKALVTNDAVILGMLMVILALIFYTSSSKSKGWVKFYSIVPSLLLCYFLPSLLNSLHIIDGESSQLYSVMSRYLLPSSLVLLTLCIDFPGLKKLGPKALIMFFTGSFGVLIGGPIAVMISRWVEPGVFASTGPDAVWRGLSTIAGSWIGGSANQAAMKELFGASDKLFSAMVTLDVVFGYLWMAFLLYGAAKAERIDNRFKADNSAITALKNKLEHFQSGNRRVTTLTDLMVICGIAFGATGLAHFLSDIIAPAIEVHAPYLERFSLTSTFFWIVVITTTIGMILATTKARNLEGAGASTIGSFLLYLLIATIGMKMDITGLFDAPALLLICAIWIIIHILIMIVVAKIIKAPFFFVAVGSMANIGGPASAPVIASAFSPALAPVGVVLAVLGYAIGTYAAYICGLLLQWASGG